MGSPSTTTTVLSPQHRLRSTALFGKTVRKGRKKGSRTVVVYVYQGAGRAEQVPSGVDERSGAGPRVGLVVSKAVGSAVTRHRVSRYLRHAAADVLKTRSGVAGADSPSGRSPLELPVGACIVIRALPASASASVEELSRDVHSCIRRALAA